MTYSSGHRVLLNREAALRSATARFLGLGALATAGAAAGIHPLAGAVAFAMAAIAAWQARRRATGVFDDLRVDVAAPRPPLSEPDINRAIYLGEAIAMRRWRLLEAEATRHYGELTQERREAIARDNIGLFAPYWLSDRLATRHVAVIGGTGYGKTNLLLAGPISQTIRRGGGMVIINAKGDWDFFVKVYALAEAFGRIDDLMFMSTEEPEISHTYNPFDPDADIRELVSVIMRMLEGVKDEFWRGVGRNALLAALTAIQAQPDRPAFGFHDLAALFSSPEVVKELYDRIPSDREVDREIVRLFLTKWVTTAQDGSLTWRDDMYRQFMYGIQQLMLDYAHRAYRRLLCDYEPDIRLIDAIRENRLVVMQVPALSDKEGTALIGRLIFADLMRAVGRLHASGVLPHTPFLVICEEYGSYADAGQEAAFQLFRSANVSLWISIQSTAYLEEVSPVFARAVIGNCGTHIYLYSQDFETIDTASKLAGTTISQFTQQSHSETFAYSHTNAQSGQVRLEQMGEAVVSGYKESRETLLQPDDFQLTPGNAILVGDRGAFRLVVPELAFDRLPGREEVRLAHFERPRREGLNLMALARGRQRLPVHGGA